MNWERRLDPLSRDGSQYTYNEFIGYYGRDKGQALWDRAGRRGQHEYSRGMKVRALTKLKGDTGQIVNAGDIGYVTELPGPYSNIDAGAVAEVLIEGVRFDAQPDMIEPASRRPNHYQNDRSQPQRNSNRSGGGGGGGGGGSDREERRSDPSEPNSKKTYTKQEFIDCYGHKKAEQLWKQAAAKEERRADPNEPKSKKKYTQQEFIDLYGPAKGKNVWKKAAEGGDGGKRCDPTDFMNQKAYLQSEFIDLYGKKKGLAIWKQAGETRPDPNEGGKKTYTINQFCELYGSKKGQALWKSAEPERRQDPSEKSKKLYTKAEFLDFYGKKGLALWKKAGEAKDKVKYITIEKETEDESIGWGRMGLIVVEVSDDSPAAKAGLRGLCKIVSINGETVTEKNIPTLIKKKSLKVGILTVRKDGDSMFTFAEFVKFYGPEKGKAAWKKAAPSKPKTEKKNEEKADKETEEKDDKKS
eukprot:TRINITY_DN519_c1_g1_i1.p1 TRINITY_DN519_c1_g1~~TRINITY_DN519_c1_g1_i1.p1  ORF type:complete len:486 (+),score=139.10 TRINITY_DN519_c1_g1_i1:50-1459(+)